MTRPLAGRNAIITGASEGLGFEIARAYVVEGASVLLSARNGARLQERLADLRGIAAAGQRVLALTADVSREADVRALASHAIDELHRIDVLVSNAGVYGPKGRIEELDWQQWVHALEINLLGPALLCRFLLPHMRTNGYGKIIQLSGGGATSPMPRISAYAASKAAVVRFAETIAEETRGSGIDVNSIAPGALNTRMLDELLEAGPDVVGREHYERAVKQKNDGGAAPARAAALAVFLGSAASDGITGKLISAVWDPWEDLASHARDLAGDVYTLRRIVPADRGFDWGER